MGIEPARPCRVRSPWALTAGGYREGQSGVLGPGAIPDILGLHCGHTLTRSGHGGISRVLFQVSEEQQKHLGETYRPGRGAFRAGFLPSIGPQLLRPNKAQHAWGQTEEKRRPVPSFCPPSCSWRIRSGLPSVGGPVQRTEPSKGLTQPGSPPAGASLPSGEAEKGRTHEVGW